MKKSPRTCIIPFRVTPEEKTKIIEKAFTSYREPSMYLRDCALQKQIVVIPGAEQIAVELRRIGNNLNQLTRAANSGDVQIPEIKEALSELVALDKKLSKILAGGGAK